MLCQGGEHRISQQGPATKRRRVGASGGRAHACNLCGAQLSSAASLRRHQLSSCLPRAPSVSSASLESATASATVATGLSAAEAESTAEALRIRLVGLDFPKQTVQSGCEFIRWLSADGGIGYSMSVVTSGQPLRRIASARTLRLTSDDFAFVLALCRQRGLLGNSGSARPLLSPDVQVCLMRA